LKTLVTRYPACAGKSFFVVRKVMFADGEHKFAVREHMSAGGEHKFAAREYKIDGV
jgi:hypothetical protein